ncbi:MAG TPA: dienelactone hydrolase family protein [Blastocatellia bacterium]|nr:dienelactone hydrolase family protein [Blastocatellia bacterium]
MASETDITTNSTKISANGKEVKVYTARPSGVAKAPAVIVIHEWWGLNPHIEDITRRYAREGFIAAAVDLYDGTTTKDAKEAGNLMSQLNQQQALEKLQIVLDHLRSSNEVAGVGVTGFCMGGTYALLLACHAKVEASAPFYGDVPTDTEIIGKLSAPVLFIGAAKDQWITLEKMNRLETALRQHGKEGEVQIYPNADHAFFNDTRPEVYAPADAEDAWNRVIAFFKRHLGKGQATSA